MTTNNKNSQPPQNSFEAWQKYFEAQQRAILQYWTEVMNSIWGHGK